MDTGADVLLALKVVVDELYKRGQNQQLYNKTHRPTHFEACETYGISVVPQLNSSTGPVIVRKVKCWIHEDDSTRTLTISRSVMEMLVYDRDALLAQVALG